MQKALLISEESFNVLIEKLEKLEQKVDTINKEANAKQWLTIEETCNYLNVSKRTLQSYRDNGILPFSQIGGKIYFEVNDLKVYFKAHYKPAFQSKITYPSKKQ